MKLSFSSHSAPADFHALLSHHDLVFRAPVCDPTFGLPLGTGDTGLLLHLSDDTLHIQINHTDLIDRLDRADAAGCDDILERNTTIRNGARLDLCFPGPIFETAFCEEYEGRLSLYDARATVHSVTPYGRADVSAIASEKYGVGVITLDATLPESAPIFATLSRFGSRTLSRWYDLPSRMHPRGTDGTVTSVTDGTLTVTQRLSDMSFAIAVRAVCENVPDARRHGNHRAELAFPETAHHTLRLYIAVGLGKDDTSAVLDAHQKLDAATAVSYDELYQAHRESWAAFWSRSYVSLPEEQDYLENLWYLNLYYANCQNKGKLPPHFCNGVWGWHYDFVPWLHYFHYNTQLGTFPLGTADHPELLTTYFNFRKNQLPIAERFCREVHGVDGAFFTDVCDYDGKMERSVTANCTCGAQIALHAYRNYLYTGDETFLREVALPLMNRTADFYLNVLKKGEDGYYHIHSTRTYEGSPLFDDSLTDHSMMRALFAALLPHTEGARQQIVREHLNHLAPFMATDFSEGDLDADGNIGYTYGIGYGMPPAADRVLATGIYTGERPKDRDFVGVDLHKGVLARRTAADHDLTYQGFPDIELSPVYPSSLVGVDDRDTDLYRMILNSVYLHPDARFEDDYGEARKKGYDDYCMGWCLMPIYLARLGLSELLEKHLREYTVTWMRFPQGFGIYSRYDRVNPTLRDRFHRYHVRDVDNGETYTVPAFPYRHFDYETLPILATALNEMLLQSYGGILRLFPAVNEEREYAFTLAAEGGFLVRAVYDRTRASAEILARRDATLTLALYHLKGAPTFIKNGTPITLDVTDGRYTIVMKAGDTLALSVGECEGIVRDYNANTDVKMDGTSQLGCPKEYSK